MLIIYHCNIYETWMDIEYVDILTAENLVTNIDLIYWPVCLSRMRGDGVKWVDVA